MAHLNWLFCQALARALRRLVCALLLLAVPTAWAQISHVSSSVGTLASSPVSSVQITKPASLATGDVMVAMVAQRGSSFPIVSSAPSGWTLLLTRDNGSSIGIAIYYRLATSSEPGSWTWNFGASDRSAGAISAFRGVDTSAPIAASNSQVNASSASMTAPSVSPAAANSMLVGLYAGQEGGTTTTAPSGMTEAYDAATGAGANGVLVASAYAVQAATGSSGTKVATASSAVVSLGALVALKAASASSVDHYEISLPSTSLACLASTVTVTACSNTSSPCTSAATTLSGQTAQLSTAGATLAATTVTFNASGVATTTLSYAAASNGTAVSVTLSGEQTAATSSRQCCPNGSSCSVANSCSSTFSTAGFIVSASAGGGAATVATQTAGTSSGQYFLRAVKSSTTSQSCQAALTGSTSVNWASQCNDPTTCSSGNRMTLTGDSASPIAANPNSGVSSYLSVPMTFDVNGNAPFTIKYADVGQVTLAASKSAGGSLLTALSGTTNAFVVKPAGFALSNIAQTAAPQLVNPAAASAAGAKFVKAGESFTATVTALGSDSVTTPNFGRETSPEGVLLTRVLVLPAGGATGTLSNASIAGGSFSAGVATVTNLSFSEVGIITLSAAIADGDYLGAGNVTGSPTGSVGRFTPARFALSAATLTQRSNLSCSPASAFSYLGENFRLGFTLTAQNSAGATTVNYSGSFAKLDPSSVTWNLAGRDASTVFTVASTRLALGSATGTFSNGVAGGITLTANATRASTPDGPFNASFGVAPVDSDGTALGSFDMASTSGGGNDRASVATVALRFGRLRLGNAIGAADRALALPVSAQYWDGSAFATHTLDSCTAIGASAVSLGNLRRTLTTADTAVAAGATLAAGLGKLTLAAPGGGRSGTVDVALSLGTLAADSSCLQPWTPGSGDAATAGANLAFLRGAWCSSSYGQDPSARATFGRQRDAGIAVYRRENY